MTTYLWHHFDGEGNQVARGLIEADTIEEAADSVVPEWRDYLGHEYGMADGRETYRKEGPDGHSLTAKAAR